MLDEDKHNIETAEGGATVRIFIPEDMPAFNVSDA
jgi:hypothetical protein